MNLYKLFGFEYVEKEANGHTDLNLYDRKRRYQEYIGMICSDYLPSKFSLIYNGRCIGSYYSLRKAKIMFIIKYYIMKWFKL